MRIIVTGGAGFIGSHIVDALLKEGHSVAVIDNLSHGSRLNVDAGAKLYIADIRSKDIEDIFEEFKPEVLCHHAAQIKVPVSVGNPILDADINILGSINLLEACRKFGVEKVIYPASAAIFGEPKYLPIDEEHPLDMISGYGVSKHTVEHYLKVYNELYGLKYTIFRYANVYGPRQDSSGEGGVVSIFSEKFLMREQPVIFGDGNQTRDFVYVEDVAKANIQALGSLDNEIYNVCTNTEVSVNELFHLFNNLTASGLKPEYQGIREGDIRNSYMSFDKINMACGWSPEVSLEEGLKRTIEYFKGSLMTNN
ncbi:MAG: NAD-dependent epimerase/dehydratase family protein [Bacillota bacterium]|nr:NAD-dependent epimerase/dehydratase family protein [Bacillota bacterium]